MPLNPQQRQTARFLYDLATKRGLPPQRAREFVAAAYAESSLDPRAVNKSSGAAGLFQLLSSGYRQKAQSLGGLHDPRANALAILPDYKSYWASHPGAAPGDAGRDVERSGEGSSFYANPLSLLTDLGGRASPGGGYPSSGAAAAPSLTPAAAAQAPGMDALSFLARRGRINPGLLGLIAQRAQEAQTAQTMPAPTTVAPGARGPVQPNRAPVSGGSGEFSMADAEGAPDARGVRHHAARDWMLGPSASVPSLFDGQVVEVKPSSGNAGQIYGGVVKIQTPDGRVLVFRHVDPSVKVGQRIRAGQPVARVTRWADNPKSSHAHTELWKTRGGGYRFENMLDPSPFLR